MFSNGTKALWRSQYKVNQLLVVVWCIMQFLCPDLQRLTFYNQNSRVRPFAKVWKRHFLSVNSRLSISRVGEMHNSRSWRRNLRHSSNNVTLHIAWLLLIIARSAHKQKWLKCFGHHSKFLFTVFWGYTLCREIKWVQKRVQTFYGHQQIAQNLPNPVVCSIWFFVIAF